MNVHNYYEKLVINQIKRQTAEQPLTQEELEDAVCLSLNRLPARYVRFDVDATFYLSPKEAAKIELRVSRAVDVALAIIRNEK